MLLSALASLCGACGKDLTAEPIKLNAFFASKLEPAAGESFTVGWATENGASIRIRQGNTSLYFTNDVGTQSAAPPHEVAGACVTLFGVGDGPVKMTLYGPLEDQHQEKQAQVGACP